MIAPARMAAIDALRAIDEQPTRPWRGDRSRPAAAAGRARPRPAARARQRHVTDARRHRLPNRPANEPADRKTRYRGPARLRLSAFQLLYQSRVPASAVIHDAVDLTRRAGKSSAAGLVNAVLRKLSRERDQLTWPGDPARHSLASAMAGRSLDCAPRPRSHRRVAAVQQPRAVTMPRCEPHADHPRGSRERARCGRCDDGTHRARA